MEDVKNTEYGNFDNAAPNAEQSPSQRGVHVPKIP